MKMNEIELSKLKELKEKSKMLKDERQKGKVIYKIQDIVVVVILAVLADCNKQEEIEDYAKEEKDFLKNFLKLTALGKLNFPAIRTNLFVQYIRQADLSPIIFRRELIEI